MKQQTDAPSGGTVHVDLHDGERGAVAVLTIDFPPVNAGNRAMRQALMDAFTSLETDGLAGVVLRGTGRHFVGGSDIREFDAPPMEPHLPDVIGVIETLPVPVVAAITGAALGGGYELALGCDARVAAADAMVGLPEVTLGLIPGAGGTLRLPRIVGREESIRLITSGRRLRAKEALRLGMIDAIAEGDLTESAIDYLKGMTHKRRLRDMPLPQEDGEAIEAAASDARRRAHGVEAVEEAIDAINDGATLPVGEALRRERERSLRLRRGAQSRALRHLFFAERQAGRIEGKQHPRPVSSIGVVGAGRMGQGIAIACAAAGFDVLLVEKSTEVLAAAMENIRSVAEKQAERSSSMDAKTVADRIEAASISDLGRCDLIIEAIIEEMDAKRALFAELERVASPDAILATNTSYLDIDEMAAGLADPARVGGLHFFNPANVMRLVEVVRTERVTPDVLATLVSVGRRMKKVPVVARVADGFIGNRMFAAYRQQCEFLIEEGATPREVDDAMRSFGMAMGPFAVFDLAGLDIAWARRKRLKRLMHPQARYPDVPDRLCEMGRFGRKTGRGWYDYREDSRGADDPEVLAMIDEASREKGIERRPVSQEAIVSRLMAALINTAADLLREGVAERASDIDLVWVHGYGFPRLQGGPLWWAAAKGRADVLHMVRNMAESSGAGIEVSEGLEALFDAITKN